MIFKKYFLNDVNDEKKYIIHEFDNRKNQTNWSKNI